MTDERLAEIEARRLRTPTPLPEGVGYPADSALTYELLRALKAERAEVERLWEWKAETLLIDWRERAEAAEAKAGELATLLDEALDAMIGKVSAPVIRSIIAKRNARADAAYLAAAYELYPDD